MKTEKRYWAHESSIIGTEARIGDGTRIWQFCNIMDGAVIGSHCNIGQGVYVESGVRIGNSVKIKNNVALYKGVVCGDEVFLGPNCVFTNVINPRSFIERKSEFRETIIERGATVGANATVLCGHKIGSYAMIGAGAVVTKDVPAHGLIVGNPGRLIGYVCKCGNKLTGEGRELVCTQCGEKYEEVDGNDGIY